MAVTRPLLRYRCSAGDSARIVPAQIAGYTRVRGEIPTAGSPAPIAGAVTLFTLAFVPLTGVSCYRNGLRQSPAVDYTLAGATITSTYWMAGDVLVCDYEHI